MGTGKVQKLRRRHTVLAEPAFIGRDKELEQLKLLLKATMAGTGRAVFISGEAGSGKTRLAKDFLDFAKTKGVTVLTGWCLSNIAVPYFPFVEAFNSLESSNRKLKPTHESQQLGLKLFGTSYEVNNDKFLSPQIWKDRLFEGITEELWQVSTSKPTILFIDDIHWADSASLALLHYISRSASSERLLIMATFRSEEIMGNADGQTQPLAESLRLMGREGLFQEIKLSNLNPKEVGAIAESMLEGRVAADFAQMLTEDSQGNPLFVVELLRMLHSRGNLIREQGVWRPSKDNCDVPDKVKDVILRRLSSLKPNQRRILDIASVIGEEFDPKLVATALSDNNVNVLEALGSVSKSTLLVMEDRDFYKFKHAKIREMIVNEIPLLLRKEYHSKLAESLEGHSDNIGLRPVSDIAYHYACAGKTEKAVEYSLLAGKDALARWGNAEAIKHFSFVLGVSEISNETRETALEGLGDSYYANCRFEDAIRVYDMLSSSQIPVIKLRALRKEMDAYWFKERDPAPLVELIGEAERLPNVDRLESARIQWKKARLTVWLGEEQRKQALNGHEQALRVFEEEYSLLDAASVVWPVGIIRIWLGNQDIGVGEILRGIAMLHELGDIRGEVLAYHVGAVDMLGFCGLFEESYNCQIKMIKLAEKISDFDSLAFGWLRLSEGPILERNYAEATLRCLKALDYSMKSDTKGVQSEVYAKLIRLYILQGNLEKASEYLAKTKAVPPDIRQFHAYHLLCAESFVLAATNRLDLATTTFELAKAVLSKTFPRGVGINVWIKSDYALLLEIQGKHLEAQKERMEIKELLNIAKKKFARPNVYANLMVKKEVAISNEFEMRIDLVNVSKNPVEILKIEDIIPSGIEILKMPENCRLENNNFYLSSTVVNPFEAKTIKIIGSPSVTGTIVFHPRLTYAGLGKTITASLKNRELFVKSASDKNWNGSKTLIAIPSFKSAPAQKGFEYLVKSFVEDNSLRKLPPERTGWRSLMDLVKKGGLTHYSVYGSSRHHGTAISELNRSGLVESRVFKGERGRGGEILKLRIAFEKECVKQYLQIVTDGRDRADSLRNRK